MAISLEDLIGLFAGDYAHLNLLSDDGTESAEFDINSYESSTAAIPEYWLKGSVLYWDFKGDQLYVSVFPTGAYKDVESSTKKSFTAKPIKANRRR